MCSDATSDIKTICSTKDCLSIGIDQMSNYIEITHQSLDEPLFFCQKHIKIMIELYSVYKGLEATIPFELETHLHAPNCYYRSRLKTESFRDFLMLVIYDLDVAISKRQQFQQNLKPDIISTGHQQWILHLCEFKNLCVQRCIDRGEKWNKNIGRYV